MWHDLRKNPDDLPKKCTVVWATVEDVSKKDPVRAVEIAIMVGRLFGREHCWKFLQIEDQYTTNSMFRVYEDNFQVVAWKELESVRPYTDSWGTILPESAKRRR